MKIKVDFRFYEVEYEIWALQKYFATTERQLPVLIEEEHKRIREELKNANEENWDLVHQELYDITENVLPRFFRAPIIVALWALYESGTAEVARYLQKAGGHNLGLRDLKGNNALDITKKYFDSILKFPLYMNESDIEHLEMLFILRNAIAHGNGRKEAVNENYWKRIQIWESEGKGISSLGDYLTFSSSFVDEQLKVVGHSLQDLIERVKAISV